MSIVALSFVMTGWLGKFSTCSRRPMRVVVRAIIRCGPAGAAPGAGRAAAPGGPRRAARAYRRARDAPHRPGRPVARGWPGDQPLPPRRVGLEVAQVDGPRPLDE